MEFRLAKWLLALKPHSLDFLVLFDQAKRTSRNQSLYFSMGNRSIYWERGFNYDRNHIIPNKVSVETYKLLMHYCAENKNCRVGAYLNNGWLSEFHSLDQIIPHFDHFADTAYSGEKILPPSNPIITKIFGNTFTEQVESIWLLKHPIYFQFESKSIIRDVLGYKFNNCISVKIEPSLILSLTGDSLRKFELHTNTFQLKVIFGSNITIE